MPTATKSPISYYSSNLYNGHPDVHHVYSSPTTKTDRQILPPLPNAGKWRGPLSCHKPRNISESDTEYTTISTHEEDAHDVPKSSSGSESFFQRSSGGTRFKYFSRSNKCLYAYVCILLVGAGLTTHAIIMLRDKGYLGNAEENAQVENDLTFESNAEGVWSGRISNTKTGAKYVAKTYAMVDDMEEIVAKANIESPGDLKKLGDANFIKITYLAGEDTPPNFQIDPQIAKVTSLEVAGPISEEWLILILTKARNLQRISIDINELCMGARIANRDSVPSVTLKFVRSLKIKNANYCPLLNWISRWEMPVLEEMILERAVINRLVYQPFKKFLETSGLSSLRFDKCWACDECDFSQFRPSLEIIKVKEGPVSYDYDDYKDEDI